MKTRLVKSHYFVLACSAIFSLLCVACTYPFASISSSHISPSELGETWQPPKRATKMAKRISAPQTIDPAIFEGDLSLAQSIDFAMQNNPDTAISWQQLQASIAELGLARADVYPSIEFSGDVTRTRRGFTFPPRTLIVQWVTSWGPELNVSYTLWDFGKRALQSESALQALFATGWSYNQEIQNMVQLITNDYYDLLYQKASLANDFQNVQDSQLILEAAEKKLKVGVGDVTQLVQAKTNYLEAEVNLVNQKDFTAQAQIQLAANMGMPANVQFSVQNFPNELPTKNFTDSLTKLLDVALMVRPDILMSKAQVKQRKAALTEAKLDYLPKIDGSLNLNYRNYSSFYRRHLDYTGKIEAKFPFFTGFMYLNQIRKAKADYKKAQAELKQQQDSIMQEVTTYFTNFQNATDRVDYAAAFLDAALEEFEVTLSNYRAGTGDIIDVMQAQTSLSNARTQYTVSVRDLFVSLTNLAYATGSLVAPQVGSSWDSIYQFEEMPHD